MQKENSSEDFSRSGSDLTKVMKPETCDDSTDLLEENLAQELTEMSEMVDEDGRRDASSERSWRFVASVNQKDV